MQGARIMARGRGGEQRGGRACGVHRRSGRLATPIVIAPMAMPRTSPRSRPLTIAAVVAAASVLAACAPEDITPTEPMALDGATLVLESVPQSATECDPAKPFTVRIRWDVKDWPDPKFDIRLRSTMGQLPARANTASGEVEFSLAHEGLWILLVDRNSQMMVAARPVPALTCPDG